MMLSENSSVKATCEKFTSPPFQEAIKSHKKGETEDVTLINTVIYEV